MREGAAALDRRDASEKSGIWQQRQSPSIIYDAERTDRRTSLASTCHDTVDILMAFEKSMRNLRINGGRGA
jgi:uncharacterized protein YfaQ (DUF2300 family)